MIPKRYSLSRRAGCPSCDGMDAKSCLRCGGVTRLNEWRNFGNGWEHRFNRPAKAEQENK